ncbi:stromal membrane-associated protein 2-like [Coregonus clupeaformis]|uniref:stromal membrane-associated protein 2-like n=1 Tax=Coregonus clupeaformis TaxID=59861 RepID=UPI001E1C60B9|nr:stromal membrane-associated protein 2-like [Coregonus clupeaformis]
MPQMPQHQQAPPAGIYMNPAQMQFPVGIPQQQVPTGYQAFPGMGTGMPPTTVMGAMMAQSGAAMMGPNTGMMVGMTMPNGFMGQAPAAGMVGMAPRMMGVPQGGIPAGMVPAQGMQGMYAIQPGQQGQWNMGQMNQQMSGMSLNGAGGGHGLRSACLHHGRLGRFTLRSDTQHTALEVTHLEVKDQGLWVRAAEEGVSTRGSEIQHPTPPATLL